MALHVDAGHTKAVHTEESTAKIIMSGENLAAEAGDPDLLAAGTVEKIAFTIPGCDPILLVTDAHFKAEKLSHALADGGVEKLYTSLFGSNDTIAGGAVYDNLNGYEGNDGIFGGKASDSIFGGTGDDELTGGAGVDSFCFRSADGVGHDVITDMDVAGMNVDYLDLDQDIVTITRTGHGHDTMLTLENGNTVSLSMSARRSSMTTGLN